MIHVKNNVSQRGFTLVELLVAFTIIGLILTISLVLLLRPSVFLTRARDAQRIHDIEQIKIALDAYYNDTNCYPATLAVLASSNTVYMKEIPKDPVTNEEYRYTVDTNTCPQWNILFGKLNQQRTFNACPLLPGSSCVPDDYDATYLCVLSGSVQC